VRCPKCGAICPPSIRFCERDGARLVPDAAVLSTTDPTLTVTCACGSTNFEEGFCTVCGRAWPTVNHALDHVEQAPVPNLAGVSDRGKRHGWNEDALSLAADGPAFVLVVCDGVSQARNSQQAAVTAADTTRAHLLAASKDSADPSQAMRQAIMAAHEAICSLPDGPDQRVDPAKSQPSGCTLVAAFVRDGHATIGWVGDSRAYRFGPDLTQLLTHDHSWFNAVVESGEMTPAQAAAAPEANAILRALGPLGYDDDAPAEPPVADLVTCDLLPGHMLLLCTDGLWKYAPEPGQLGDLVRGGDGRATQAPLELSRSLVDFANAHGGTDNVTAAILYRRQEAK
jgi:serine/threonine protein phosphatase PrpC